MMEKLTACLQIYLDEKPTEHGLRNQNLYDIQSLVWYTNTVMSKVRQRQRRAISSTTREGLREPRSGDMCQDQTLYGETCAICGYCLQVDVVRHSLDDIRNTIESAFDLHQAIDQLWHFGLGLQ